MGDFCDRIPKIINQIAIFSTQTAHFVKMKQTIGKGSYGI